jgi:dipeptidyl aminopeptidase/acylaminoacyl peptidase
VKRHAVAGLVAGFSMLAVAVLGPQALPGSLQRGQPSADGRVYKMQITPHWFMDNTRFWYRNALRGGDKEFILVEIDEEGATRKPAFDHGRLAASLSKAAGADYRALRLPFDEIAFADDGKTVSFRVGDTNWKSDLSSYECTKIDPKPVGRLLEEAASRESLAQVDAETEARRQTAERARVESLLPDGPNPFEQPELLFAAQQRERDRGGQTQSKSPDGRWTAFIKDHNIFGRAQDGAEVQLSKDGQQGNGYGMLEWAPDSSILVAFRIEPGENKEVYLMQSSPPGGGRAKLQARPYALPGDKFTAYELNLFDVTEKTQLKPEVERVDFGRPRLRWRKDGRSFTYEKHDRGHQRFRLIEVDARTGKARNLIDEKAETFIWSAHTENVNLRAVTWLQQSDEIIHATEKDGWRHLYLLDAKDGTVKNLITPGDYVVRGVDRIDEDKRQVWFRAGGKHSDQDPYFIHYFRVNFDGTGLVALTEGDGNHTIAYSPGRKHFIDKYERVDLPPVHELRRASDGKLMCKLEEADITELKAGGWAPPKVFVAKGRDGKTDIWGLICRPRDFDPAKKYPVIENIYAGPQGSFVPKRFSTGRLYSEMTDLGFVVAKIDGMGTTNRSKAFHDVCWKNLKDAGLPDRILWHQAAAKKYPWYDISRVGIYGGSAGGQSAMGALLFHPEFYKVGVAGCGCHDNRLDKASWNEQWMGYPVGPHYAESSNVDNAYRLRGKLLLIVGELDTNVPPESTLRVVDALVRAGKDFDMLVIPNTGHGMGGAYGSRRMRDFFVRHLHGVEPADRNGTRAGG